MGKYRVGVVLVFCLALLSLLAGCGRSGSDSVAHVTSQSELTTNVRFVIAGQDVASAIRAQAAVPQVTFELRLLDASNSQAPIIKMRKTAAVVASGSVYNATADFINVPVFPAIASMTISGGYLVDSLSQHNKNWVGKADLVAASENVITLVGKGDKSAADVSVNLLEQLIAAPANVATLATPIFAKVDAVVASLTLTSSSVYADALQAYNTAYGNTPSVPEDAEFTPPTGYSSLAFPKTATAVALTMNSFGATSESWVVMMNRSVTAQIQSCVVPAVTGSIRPAVLPEKKPDEHPLTLEQLFQLQLRNFKKPPTPSYEESSPLLRPSLRAVVVDDILPFKAHVVSGGYVVVSPVQAKCMRVADISGRKTYFFLDTDDLAVTNINTIIDGVYNNWTKTDGIYNTDRSIFGNEPAGNFQNLGLTVDDLYILISRKIFTAGYFWGANFYPVATNADSNEKKIFFLQLDEVDDASRAIGDLSSTMAHEFQHMIHFGQKFNVSDQNSENTWLDEAMSGYAEYINGFRIETANNQSKAIQADYYLDRVNQIRVDNWYLDGDSNEVASAHYGKAFLFGVWLAQNYGTNGVVQNLLSVQSVSRAAVEAFTGETFDETFAKFMLALAVNDTAGGTFGFKGLDLNSTYSFGDGADIQLSGPQGLVIDPATADGYYNLSIAAYTAAYIKITNGNGSNISINSTLQSDISLFHLRKN